MNRFFHPLFVISSFCLAFSSCEENQIENSMVPQEGYYATMEDPVAEDGTVTKALDDNFKFSFVSGDEITVYPFAQAGTRMIYSMVPDPDDPKRAAVNVSNFNILDETYTAAYPAVYPPVSSDGSVSVLFSGQSQNGVLDPTAHLYAFDYNWAKTSFSNNAGVFSFKHRVSWLKMSIQATEAAVITSVTVSADEGVANSATLNTLTGELVPVRKADDVLILGLGGSDGIGVAAGESIDTYITIAPGIYTNLTMTAVDTEGHKYVFTIEGEKNIEIGKYYSRTLTRTDIPEDTPFTSLTGQGCYSSTNTASPVSVKVYNEATDQMSYGTGSDYRTFKLADLASSSYSIFTIASSTLTVGETYTVSSDINGTKSEASCKVVKMTDNCVWLEDKSGNNGYIFAIE